MLSAGRNQQTGKLFVLAAGRRNTRIKLGGVKQIWPIDLVTRFGVDSEQQFDNEIDQGLQYVILAAQLKSFWSNSKHSFSLE